MRWAACQRQLTLLYVKSVSLTGFELAEHLGVFEATEPRHDAADVEIFATVGSLREDTAYSFVCHRRIAPRHQSL